jgi:hypothetical protein
MSLFPKKYRNIFFKDYAKFPYQKLTGRNILLYTGKLMKYDEKEYDSNRDYFFDCDCKYPLWKELKKLV